LSRGLDIWRDIFLENSFNLGHATFLSEGRPKNYLMKSKEVDDFQWYDTSDIIEDKPLPKF